MKLEWIARVNGRRVAAFDGEFDAYRYASKMDDYYPDRTVTVKANVD